MERNEVKTVALDSLTGPAEFLPCPFCGNRWPWTHITFSCAVLRCSCGVEMQNGAVQVMYRRGEVPQELLAHAYEPTAFAILKDGEEVPYPEHGYVGVNVLAAFEYAGLTSKWNTRANASLSRDSGEGDGVGLKR